MSSVILTVSEQLGRDQSLDLGQLCHAMLFKEKLFPVNSFLVEQSRMSKTMTSHFLVILECLTPGTVASQK